MIQHLTDRINELVTSHLDFQAHYYPHLFKTFKIRAKVAYFKFLKPCLTFSNNAIMVLLINFGFLVCSSILVQSTT